MCARALPRKRTKLPSSCATFPGAHGCDFHRPLGCDVCCSDLCLHDLWLCTCAKRLRCCVGVCVSVWVWAGHHPSPCVPGRVRVLWGSGKRRNERRKKTSARESRAHTCRRRCVGVPTPVSLLLAAALLERTCVYGCLCLLDIAPTALCGIYCVCVCGFSWASSLLAAWVMALLSGAACPWRILVKVEEKHTAAAVAGRRDAVERLAGGGLSSTTLARRVGIGRMR